MRLLRSHETAWRSAELDEATNTIRVLPVWEGLLRRSDPTKGWYSRLGGSILAVYPTDGELLFHIDGETVPFDDRLAIQLMREEGHTTLTVRRDGRNLSNVQYRTPRVLTATNRDLTAGIEPEQFDFGLFLQNLSLDPERRRRLAAA